MDAKPAKRARIEQHDIANVFERFRYVAPVRTSATMGSAGGSGRGDEGGERATEQHEARK